MLKCLVCDRDIEERTGERRKGIELTGKVTEETPKTAVTTFVWRERNAQVWSYDRRMGNDRRKAQ